MTAELELDADGLAKVPTCVELGRAGLARDVVGYKGETPRWEIFPAGYALLKAAMKHNAEVLRADPVLRRRLEAQAFR